MCQRVKLRRICH